MEPKHSAAGYALETIMQKMPTRWEPVIGIIRAQDEQQLHDDWQKVDAHWAELQKAGKIKSFSTPAALALSPRKMQTNRAKLLESINFAAARTALETAITENGFSPETFASADSILDELEAAAARIRKARPDWRTLLRTRAGGSWSIAISRMTRS